MTKGELVEKVLTYDVGYRGRDAAKALIDIALIATAAAWAWSVSYGQLTNPGSPLGFLTVVLSVRLSVYWALKLYRTPWRKVSRYDVFRLGVSAVLGTPIIAILLLVLPEPVDLRDLARPYLVLLTEPAFYLTLLCGVRFGVRAVATNHRQGGAGRRVLVVGTGDAARSFVWQIQESVTEYQIVGFVDDDPARQHSPILGLPVLGGIDDLAHLVRRFQIDQIVIAVPMISPEQLRRTMVVCEPTGVPIRILPPLRDLMEGDRGPYSPREVRMEDLLPRPEAKLDWDAISRCLGRKTVLVTGGGGSIGRELCRQILRTGAERVVVLGRGENSIFEVIHALSEIDSGCELVPAICDVRDRAGMNAVFERFQPQVVFHAAAHKHVPMMEEYPAEAVKNNVLGTLCLADLAIEHDVERLVLVSTDKAVDPSSVMGATKRISEMIIKGYAQTHGANMVSVRFGNVLGSRGSVIWVMKRQIERRLPITITDPDMFRYFMTIPEAAQLILQAGAIGGQGEIFVLDMGSPVRIMDLAHDLIRLSGLAPNRDIPIRIIGRRAGEKLQEELLTESEAAGARKLGPFYMAQCLPISLPTLLAHVAQLRVAAERGQDHQVVEALQRLVPTLGNGVAVAAHRGEARLF